MGSMNYAKYSASRKDFVFKLVFTNPFDEILELLAVLNELGIKPEHECFDIGHVGSLAPLVDMGVLRKPLHIDFVMGVVGGIPATARNVAAMADNAPDGAHWGVIGVSRTQWLVVAAALTLGGSIRVGLEDNFYLPDGIDGSLQRRSGGKGPADEPGRRPRARDGRAGPAEARADPDDLLASVRNLRDAGGHAAGNGERLRSRVLWRGDAPVDINHSSSRRMSSLQLSTIVDLRSPRERQLRPYDPGDLATRSVAIALVEDQRPKRISLRNGFAEFNRWVLEERGDQLASVVRALAVPAALPALVHCTAGKDRTGVVTAVVQAWLGVPDDVIAWDYALSAEMLRADTDEAIGQQRLALGVDARSRPELLEARPEWIISALDWLRETYGTAEEYLLAHSARPEELERLREALLAGDRRSVARCS